MPRRTKKEEKKEKLNKFEVALKQISKEVEQYSNEEIFVVLQDCINKLRRVRGDNGN